MRLLPLPIAALLLIASLFRSDADEPPAPPTDPSISTSLGIFGVILPGQTLFHSFDSGQQYVGTSHFPRYWYKFSLQRGNAQKFNFYRSFGIGPGFGASYQLYNSSMQLVGLLNDPALSIGEGTYFLQVSAGSPTKFHFGMVAYPSKSTFQDGAGPTESAPHYLGVLKNVISFSSDFYTYYTRQGINQDDPSQTYRTLNPNFASPDPVVQSQYYSFNLLQEADVKVLAPNEDTYLFREASSGLTSIIKGGQAAHLMQGLYILQICDQYTQVMGGGGGSTFYMRDPQRENFEHLAFTISTSIATPSATPSTAPSPPVVDLGPPPVSNSPEFQFPGH